MKTEELQQVVDRAKNSEGTVNDAILVLAAMFESVSRHLKDIRLQQIEILKNQGEQERRLSAIEEHTTGWVYRAVVED